MLIVLQRVKSAKVIIDEKLYSEIEKGFLIFLGICKDDNEDEVDHLVEKISTLRIMPDENNKMNKSIMETKGEVLIISQFTLCANLKGRRRPDFFPAKEPREAERLYNQFVNKLSRKNLRVQTGQFAAHMQVKLVNDGPVTFILDSKEI